LLLPLGTKYIGALVAPAATVVDEPSTFTRTANVVSFTMITDASAGPLACGCGVVEADVEGLVLGLALAFADGLLVALGFGLALAVADELVLGVAVGALEVADTVAEVGDDMGTTLVAMVGGGHYIHAQSPDEVAALVIPFLKEHARA